MRHFILIVIFIGSLSCQTKTKTEKINKSNTEIDTDDIFCDTTKVTDFQDNLKIVNDELTAAEKESQDKKAKTYIDEVCEKDSLFCGTIKSKISKMYVYDKEWKILLTGYVLGESAMEESSAGFFVTTVYRNNEPKLTDVLSDLMGEIKVELNGFESKSGQVKIWGHAYPYFNADYGKFRLTFEDGQASYEFQCHEGSR